MSLPRRLDLVLLGATGFAGALTAEYLAAHAPADLRWAVAGRNLEALDTLRTRLSDALSPPGEVLWADVTDAESIRSLVSSARLVITTVGPYLRHGEAVVAACAEAGTDYVDLTGEAEFVDRTYLRHHATAVASGARLVHCCGFDSVPHDLGAQFTVEHLPDDVPLTVRGVVRSSAAFSGGTFHSALDAVSRMNEAKATARERRAVEPRPEGRSSRAVVTRPQRDPVLNYWLLPLPTVDPMIVARSGAALEEYGPRFTYSHHAGTKTLPMAVAGVVGVGALVAAAQASPVRRVLASKVPAGSGPSQEKRDRSWFTVDFVGDGDGKRVHTRVSGGDPGYTETAAMLAESALSLLLDDNPTTVGQVTPAVAMGPNLRTRLIRHGMTFEVVEEWEHLSPAP